jgi:uncharacterized protein
MATKVVIPDQSKMPKNPVIIEGFPSKGFVSTITARYLIDEMKMETIGYLESESLHSVAVIHDSKPMRPIRVYCKGDIVILFSEIIIPIPEVPEFSHAIIDFIKQSKPDKVILLAGISGKDTEKDHEIFGMADSPEMEQKLRELKVSGVQEGMMTGISSELLLHCTENKIPWISLMAETKNLPDPLASASMLAILTKLLDLKVDTKRLLEEGKKIEEMFKEITSQLQKGKDGYKAMENYSPMYG